MKKLNRPMVFILSAAMAGTLMHVPVYAEESMTSEETLRVTEETDGEQTETMVTVETTETTAESVVDTSAIETVVKSETETEKIQEETVDEETLKEAGDPVEAFVSRLYEVILGRNADPAGLKAWTDVLKSGREQGAKVAQGFVDSPEMKARNLSDDAYVRALYRAFFDREADEAGLDAWKNVLNSGLSRLHVFRGFAESDEFTKVCQRYGIVRGYAELTAPRDQNEGITKFIYRCYQKFLGRKADESGLNSWAEALLAGRNNAKEVAYGFVMSSEFQGMSLSNTDYVRNLYQGLFNRDADEGGLAAWAEKLDSGNSRESVFYGFADSREFRKLAQSFGLSGDWKGTPVTYKISKEAFIQCLMDNRSVWEMSKYDATNYSGYFEPGYSMIDLDLDGQPELVVTMAGGTMHNAPTNIYKVQDGKVVLISSADAGSGEIQDLTLYYNNAEGRYVYVDKQIHRSGIYFVGETIMEMDCSGNSVSGTAKFEHAKERSSSSSEYTHTYFIGNNKVSESQYTSTYNAYFGNMRNTNMQKGFVAYKNWKGYSVTSKKTELARLYDAFSYQK